MRAIDTNLLVRYFTNDEPDQVAIVEQFFDQCQEAQEPIFVPIPVVCELAWVLHFRYRFEKARVVEALHILLEQSVFQVEDGPLVHNALQSYRNGPAGLADYLIGELALAAGCSDTVTFDRALRNTPGFTIL